MLARLLTPRDFGAIALGATFVAVLGVISGAGIGAGLIRSKDQPDRADLQSFLALQLIATTAFAGMALAIAVPFGTLGAISAVMIASLPVSAFRQPGVIVLERDLRYQPLVAIELGETLVYNVWAVATVLAGWGVWGLATAAIVRAAFGSALTIWVSPVGLLLPKLDVIRVRRLAAFGMQYQAVDAVVLFQLQGLNIGIGAIAGVSVLGLWSLAFRILQIPYLLFSSAWRVSFPAMSRLVAMDEDVGPIVERGIALAAVVTGFLLAPLVASGSALIPEVFGAHWAPAASVIPWAALGLSIGGPVSVATAGFLYAVGDSKSVLTSVVSQTLAWFAITFSLLPSVGLPAVGVGWLAAQVVDAVVLERATKRRLKIRVFRHLTVPIAAECLAAAFGYAVSLTFASGVIQSAVAVATSVLTYSLLIALVQRRMAIDVARLALRTLAPAS